ncbi:MAG: glycerate 2-kinase [Gammaproteobacteria bacterium]|jgi:glycerate 2-kinase
MNASETRKQTIETIWKAAIASVAGYQAVANALATDPPFQPGLVLAVGKAAVGMCQGALDNLAPCAALVVTKYDHADADFFNRPQVEVIESAHPVPDQNSILAGKTLLERISDLSNESRVLLLVSGGASSLAESLVDGTSLQDLQRITDEMLSAGNTIAEINGRRKQLSLIKDGRLIEAFKGIEIRVYAISDVEGDSIGTIGSGIGDCYRACTTASSTIIASNQIARNNAVAAAEKLGLSVHHNEESLFDDLFSLVPVIAQTLESAKPGMYLWGGEPTVVLPQNPGRGGRNQSLALALAETLQGRNDISVLVAGTDGTDGPTDAAGGLVDGDSWGDTKAARDALSRADAGPYLEQRNSLFVTGPTNTNVMDLIIAIVD